MLGSTKSEGMFSVVQTSVKSASREASNERLRAQGSTPSGPELFPNLVFLRALSISSSSVTESSNDSMIGCCSMSSRMLRYTSVG